MACGSRDLLSRPVSFIALFALPALAMVLTGRPEFDAGWRTVVWTAALGILGTACTVNAIRCGRIHCYVTGPFFVVMAVASLLYGVGVLPLGKGGWQVLGSTILVGAMVLCCVPELLFGKYRKRPSMSGDGDRG